MGGMQHASERKGSEIILQDWALAHLHSPGLDPGVSARRQWQWGPHPGRTDMKPWGCPERPDSSLHSHCKLDELFCLPLPSLGLMGH